MARTTIRTEDITASEVTTAKMADSAFLANRNVVINGDMQIAQRGTSVQKQYDTSNGYYTCDRVRTSQSALDNAVWTMTQDSHLLTGPTGFPNSWKITVDTAETALATDEHIAFQMNLEAANLQNLAYGTSAARTITISFWVKSDVAATYAMSIYASDADRNMGGTYTINGADTWEYKTITFVGDTSGTGINNDTGRGLTLYWYLSAGTDRTSVDNTSWAAYSTTRAAFGQTANILATATDYWQITGVQLEIGTTATPFEHKSFGQELAACQRYYNKTFAYATAPANGAGHTWTGALLWDTRVTTLSPSVNWQYPVAMRALPTVTLYNTRASGTAGQWTTGGSDGANARALTTSETTAAIDNTGTTLGAASWGIHATAESEL